MSLLVNKLSRTLNKGYNLLVVLIIQSPKVGLDRSETIIKGPV